jgi:hypothetical protein
MQYPKDLFEPDYQHAEVSGMMWKEAKKQAIRKIYISCVLIDGRENSNKSPF